MKNLLSIALPALTLCLLFSTAAAATGDGARNGTVTEVINAGSYVYLHLADPEVWVATSPMEVAAGDRVSYRDGMEMRDFHSKALDRTFASILFVQDVRIDGRDPAQPHEGAALDGAGLDHPAISPVVAVPAPASGEIPAVEGGMTVAGLFSAATSLEGQSVSLRARVMKVSENIMGKNWITLQDGTGAAPQDRLLATSTQSVEPGAVVVVTATLRNDIDIGSGYRYAVLLENASFE